jgi:hypothetical protein
MLIPEITPIQPITVTVNQPPGWPLWLTTLFSASVGALFAIATNVVTELFRNRLRKKKAIRQLGAELMENMERIEGAERILKDAETRSVEDKRGALYAVDAYFFPLNSEWFDHLSQTEINSMYEIDHTKELRFFYRLAKGMKFDATQDDEVRHNFQQDLVTCGSLMMWGREFIGRHSLKYRPEITFFEKKYMLEREIERRDYMQ